MPPEQTREGQPVALPNPDSSTYVDGASALSEQLQCDSKRLFLQDTEKLSVKAVEFNGSEWHSTIIDSELGIDNYLNLLSGCTIRIIMIQQQSSWGRLTISARSMHKLMSALAVFPAFVDIITSFGTRTSYQDFSFNAFRYCESEDQSSKEIAYLFKHPERHGRDETDDKWSIRQFGIWHGQSGTMGDSFIVLNPAQALQAKLKDLTRSTRQPSSDDVHVAALSSALGNLRGYTSEIEGRYLDMKTKPQVVQVDSVHPRPSEKLESMQIDDIQDIQVLQDKLQILDYALDSNAHVLDEVSRRLRDNGRRKLEDLTSIVTAARGRLRSLSQRLGGTIALVTTILDFKCLASLEYNSRLMAEITRLTHDENAMVIELTKKASRDTDIVKTLTLAALVYLPASLTASMMGMQYINVVPYGSSITLRFKGEFWVFLVLTLALLMVTLGGYGIWYHMRRKSWQREVVPRSTHAVP